MDSPFTISLNASLLALAFLGAAVALVFAGRWASGGRRALSFAQRSGLPLHKQTGAQLAAWMRRTSIAELIATLIALALCAPLLLTPLAHSGLFMFAVIFAVLSAMLIADTFIVVRFPLFTPDPDAARVARVRVLRTMDYLGRARVALPWAIAVGAAVVIAVACGAFAAGTTPAQPEYLIAGGVAGALGLALCASLPLIDRRILAPAQPASDALELAWDDLSRTASLNTVRLVVTTVSLFAVAFTLSAYTPTGSAWFGFTFALAPWAQLLLQRALPTDGRGLAPGLRPASVAPARQQPTS